MASTPPATARELWSVTVDKARSLTNQRELRCGPTQFIRHESTNAIILKQSHHDSLSYYILRRRSTSMEFLINCFMYLIPCSLPRKVNGQLGAKRFLPLGGASASTDSSGHGNSIRFKLMAVHGVQQPARAESQLRIIDLT